MTNKTEVLVNYLREDQRNITHYITATKHTVKGCGNFYTAKIETCKLAELCGESEVGDGGQYDTVEAAVEAAKDEIVQEIIDYKLQDFLEVDKKLVDDEVNFKVSDKIEEVDDSYEDEEEVN